MKRFAIPTLCVVAASGLLFVASARADERQPNAAELTRIEAALREGGFRSWDDVELEDGVWEVEDAVDAEGKKWDIKLDPTSMAIIERDAD